MSMSHSNVYFQGSVHNHICNVNICIRYRWEEEMGSSQHKSPHQARAFRRGIHVVTSAEISPYRRTQRYSMYFLVGVYLFKAAKSN